MNETAFYRETNAKTLRGPYLLLGSEELTKQEALDRVLKLLDEHRISCYAPADYTEGSELDGMLKGILDRTAESSGSL